MLSYGYKSVVIIVATR